MKSPDVRGALDTLANSRGRPLDHVLAGAGMVAGALALSALVAGLSAPKPHTPRRLAPGQPAAARKVAPARPALSAVWPPLFLALTLSGLRIWNAPKSPARSQALTLWGLVQALNAAWLAFGPRRLPAQLATAAASLGAGGAYVWRAGKVDAPAARMVAPYVSWISVAGVLTEELWRKGPGKPTLH